MAIRNHLVGSLQKLRTRTTKHNMPKELSKFRDFCIAVSSQALGYQLYSIQSNLQK